MDSSSSAASGRRAASFFATGAWRFAAMLLFAVCGSTWSGATYAQAAVCNFSAITTGTQTALAGSTVSFQVQISGACPAAVQLDFLVDTAGDTTGGATVVAPNPAVVAVGPGPTTYTFQVTLGPDPGGTGVVDATCTGCTGTPTLQFLFATNNDIDWTPVPSSLVVSSSQTTDFSFGTNLIINGSPSTFIDTTFENVTTTANYGTVTPDAFGDADSGNQSITTAGTYTLRASPVCPPPTFALPECAALTPHLFTLTVEPVSVTRISAATETIVSGGNVTVTARYGSPSFPEPDGSTLLWSVTRAGGGGDGSITPSPVAGGGGETDAVFTATIPGVYTVTALTTCTFCTPNSTTFDVTVTAIPFTLTPVSADPATGDDGDPFTFTVALDQGGTPVVGATIDWTAGFPFTPASATSTTVAGGQASATFTATGAGTFTNVVTATYDPDGTPLSGDEVVYQFDATINSVPELTIEQGDGQTSPVGVAFTDTLMAWATDSGVDRAGLQIDWTLLSGSATFPASSITDATGIAEITVMPTGVGPIQIQAARSDDPTVTIVFNLTATPGTPTITIVSANPASGTVGTAMPFTVHVEEGGFDAVGATVSWTANAPFSPATASTTTSATGDTTANFTPSAAGTFTNVVTATYDQDGTPLSGDEVSVSFDAGVTSVPTLTISGGDGQTGDVGTPYPIDLGVVAQNSGAPAGGINIAWTVVSGAATIVNNGPTTFTGGDASATVTPTAAGPLVITAERSDAPGVIVTFNLTATGVPTLVINGGDGQTTTVGTAFPAVLSVIAENSGVAAPGVTIDWVVTAGSATVASSGATDPAGEAHLSVTPTAAGTITITATRQDAPTVSVTFNLTATSVATLAITGGDGQTSMVGTPYPVALAVLAEDSGVAAAGIGIDWAVTVGSATLAATTTTSGTGAASNTVTPTADGPITITATRQDAPTESVTFNLTATAQPYVMTAVSANPASGTVGSPVTFTISLEQGGTPVSAAGIQWTATAPFAPASSTSSTGANGEASASFTPAAAGTFANVVTATYDPDGNPGNGDEIATSFGAVVAAVPTLSIQSGDAQSALPGAAFALPLEVLAEDSGLAAAGVTIDWTVTGDATLAASGPTDASGVASATVTAGTTVGPVTITAARQDAPTASVTFNLTISAFGTLTILGGNGQTLDAGVPSEPMEVELKDATGTPIAGAVVTWTTTGGTLESEPNTTLGKGTTVTDANGIASNTVTVTTPGKITVTASSPLAGAPALFVHNGALGNLTGLTPEQTEVVEAIDTLCPALAALPSPTPEQADLLARCQELTDAAGIDPAAAVAAIDELLTDVAMAQGQAALIALQTQFQNLKARIAALRSGTQGVSFGGLAVNTPAGPISLGTLSSAFTAEEEPATGPTGEIGTDFSRWGFFAAGTLGRGEQDEGSVDPEFDYDLNGLTAGVDYRWKDSWIFGAAFGYTRQDTSLPDDEGSVDTDGWSLSGYTTYYTKDSWYLDGVVTFGSNDYELIRNIEYTVPVEGGGTSTISQQARASAGGDLLQGAFTFGRDFNRGALGIGPYAKLLYTRIGFDEIEEELGTGPGSGLGLRIEERTLTSMASVIGGKLTYTHSTEWGVLMPHLQLEWEHEFRDDPQRLEASFLHDPTGTGMIVRGDPIDTDYLRFGLGLSMVLAQGRSGFFYYEHLLGRDGISQWNLALGIRLEF